MAANILTTAQKRNLRKLARFLDRLPEDLAKKFAMNGFSSAGGPEDVIRAEHHCGTSACAVGWAPVALGHRPGATRGIFGWFSYSSKYLAPEASPEWSFMFDGHWAGRDNSPRGAAARIRYVLADRPVPCGLSERLQVDYSEFLAPAAK